LFPRRRGWAKPRCRCLKRQSTSHLPPPNIRAWVPRTWLATIQLETAHLVHLRLVHAPRHSTAAMDSSSRPRGGLAGRRVRRAASVDSSPFYAPKPDAREVQQRVLEDARASAAERFVTTSRPFTPADRSRGLFGASTRGGDRSPANPPPLAADARPPSAFP